ncbi:putative toxin-antitoxin system toxin component, PIN family [Sphingobium sp. AS12]|uniref:putative toxin-antitoxin system toxin component, PIN family n=1 Tax=Sphingobium sp. AS12 TaxID=2849495 RepID=UPI001C31B0E8|nr:putative toxin-antitoxin system toxin component, PIN family [Sphingobium sp. AS12]MBV2150029.1 putative toxin-antitoxin system toxin component, PIN family [Sphingobium sp. AS12]
MRVVLDTNVLLAALISSEGPPDAIYRAWRGGRFELVTSMTQLGELRRVSRYPKLKAILPPHRVGAMINNLQRAIVLETLPPLPHGIEPNDPDDIFLLTTALGGAADFLVTGDRRAGLLQMGNIGRTRIVTPAMFHQETLESSRSRP